MLKAKNKLEYNSKAKVGSQKTSRKRSMSNKVLKINKKDNVIVALQDLAKSDSIAFEGETYILQEDICFCLFAD